MKLKSFFKSPMDEWGEVLFPPLFMIGFITLMLLIR